MISFTEDMLDRGFIPGQIILDMGFINPPPIVLEALNLPSETENLFRVNRICLANNEPISLQTSYLALSVNQGFSPEELESVGSLYTLLKQKYNIMPVESEETLEVTLASYREAALLKINEGSPLLLYHKIMWIKQHQAFEYTKIYYRGDRYKYTIKHAL